MNKSVKGIYASFEELVEQRKYINNISYDRKKSASQYVGDINSLFKGRGVEFEEVREYEFGDEVRDIDWKVTARKGNPYTKVYNEERNIENYIFLDLSSSMVFGTKKELKSVLASKISALFAWASFNNKDKFGCFIYDGNETFFFKAKSSKDNILAILKKISEISQKITKEPKEDKLNLNLALMKMHKHIKYGGNLFIISDFEDFENITKVLFVFSKKNKLFLINICDNIEIHSPLSGEYKVINKKDDFVFSLEKGDELLKYEQYFVHKNSVIQSFCHKIFAKYFNVILGIDGYKQL